MSSHFHCEISLVYTVLHCFNFQSKGFASTWPLKSFFGYIFLLTDNFLFILFFFVYQVQCNLGCLYSRKKKFTAYFFNSNKNVNNNNYNLVNFFSANKYFLQWHKEKVCLLFCKIFSSIVKDYLCIHFYLSIFIAVKQKINENIFLKGQWIELRLEYIKKKNIRKISMY